MHLKLPELVPIKQNFPHHGLTDIPGTLRRVLAAGGLGRLVKPGRRVAVTAGSRGIANIVLILATMVEEIKKLGAEPRILAAMGSHGGGAEEGRLKVLAGLGITPAAVGAPVDAGADPVQAGVLPQGLPLCYNRLALTYDAIIVVNRVKPHTSFHGPAESGLQKMVAVGLGGPAGASALHSRGASALPEVIPAAARALMEIIPVVLGVAILEDAHENTAGLVAVDPADFGPAESRLLNRAWSLLPRLPVEQLDLLIVDHIGKDISGTGMDTNVIGRLRIQGLPEPSAPVIRRIVALDLSPGTRGNAYGIGLADFTTRHLVDKIDFPATCLNAMTSTFLQRVMLPMTLDTGRAAVETALNSLGNTGPGGARVARISDTRRLDRLEVSANLLPELAINPLVEIAGPPRPMIPD
jgi:hypothetical protein